MEPFRIFIGWDAKEAEAFHVLSHSIITRSKYPVSITPIVKSQLPEYKRARGPSESTDFSLTRFLVPHLSGYKGVSLYMDCDMLVQCDITDILMDYTLYPDKAVHVVKHDYEPISDTKMGGMVQTPYPRKNWSSFILFNNRKCTTLTPEYVNQTKPSLLHQFGWIPDGSIRGLDMAWNWLVGEYPPHPKPRVLHYTLGGPWMGGTEETGVWLAERARAFGATII